MITQASAQAERLSMGTRNRFKLGLFAANCSEGRAVTRAPERWLGGWPDNVRLAKLADEAGIDFLLPIGRWKGYGGKTDHQGTALETLTWASALLASTNRVRVFSTVHTPLFHPLTAAKQMVTVDQVGAGRFGLNIVCGWNEGEFAMFGLPQFGEHERYEHGQEWIDVVKLAWGEDDADFDGHYFKLKGIREKPKPYGGTRPFLMNAGQSGPGRAYATRNCDALFTSLPFETDPVATRAEVERVEQMARASNNEIGVFLTGSVTCRRTRREAEDYRHYALEEQADWDALDAMIVLRGHASPSAEEREVLRRKYTSGMGGFNLVGTPDDIAAGFAKAAQAGISGAAFSLISYLVEFPYVRDEVLPRLERLGLRESQSAHNTS
jgi:dimethylsulfone monooxygenase